MGLRGRAIDFANIQTTSLLTYWIGSNGLLYWTKALVREGGFEKEEVITPTL